MEALGPVLLLISIPLILRWVPPNRIYGFRIPPTLRNPSVWYDTNAQSGRHFFVLGLLMIAIEFAAPDGTRSRMLWLTGVAGLAIIIFLNFRSAYRWERERSTTDGRHPA